MSEITFNTDINIYTHTYTAHYKARLNVII